MSKPRSPGAGFLTRDWTPELVEIPYDRDLIIGRHPSSDIIVHDAYVSRHHVKLYTVDYDENAGEFAPMLFAQNISTSDDLCFWSARQLSLPTVHNWRKLVRNETVVLCHGDRLRVSRAFFTFTATNLPSEPHNPDWGPVQDVEQKALQHSLRITNRFLGGGSAGTVYLAYDNTDQEGLRQVACKIIRIPHTTTITRREENIRKFSREIDTLKHLSHPNIVRLQRVYRSEHTIYICEELAGRGDLRSYLDARCNEQTQGCLNDTQARHFSFQLFKALEYIHTFNVAHRDLKPENVLLDSVADNPRVMLTDFGSAYDFSSSSHESTRNMTTLVGTPAYLAPEVSKFNHGQTDAMIRSSYDTSVDLWAAGAFITALFGGDTIIALQAAREVEAETGGRDLALEHRTMSHKARKCDLSELETRPEWRDMGPKAHDLIKNLLVTDPTKRLKANAALQHPWFTIDAADLQAEWHSIASKWQDSRANPVWQFNDIDININEIIRLNNLQPQLLAALARV